MISSGTSAATPTAAGAGALLISAAKQQGIPYDVLGCAPAGLAALISSAPAPAAVGVAAEVPLEIM